MQKKISKMSYKDFKDKLKSLGYSITSFAKEVGIEQTNVSRWNNVGVPKWAEAYIETKIEVESLKASLLALSSVVYTKLDRGSEMAICETLGEEA